MFAPYIAEWAESYVKTVEIFGKSVKLLPSDQLGGDVMLTQILMFLRGKKNAS